MAVCMIIRCNIVTQLMEEFGSKMKAKRRVNANES